MSRNRDKTPGWLVYIGVGFIIGAIISCAPPEQKVVPVKVCYRHSTTTYYDPPHPRYGSAHVVFTETCE